ncbi:uncharacterized protein LOC131622828 [Vicia villosa]|uniref:uncharacterized protein LOC131622828 n=1 Tax=Vicia villosa TaxID=3911 RepID=UPI00273C3190|nr:uncharacterized protein LOC131622828 [Vicia villosa]
MVGDGKDLSTRDATLLGKDDVGLIIPPNNTVSQLRNGHTASPSPEDGHDNAAFHHGDTSRKDQEAFLENPFLAIEPTSTDPTMAVISAALNQTNALIRQQNDQIGALEHQHHTDRDRRPKPDVSAAKKRKHSPSKRDQPSSLAKRSKKDHRSHRRSPSPCPKGRSRSPSPKPTDHRRCHRRNRSRSPTPIKEGFLMKES